MCSCFIASATQGRDGVVRVTVTLRQGGATLRELLSIDAEGGGRAVVALKVRPCPADASHHAIVPSVTAPPRCHTAAPPRCAGSSGAAGVWRACGHAASLVVQWCARKPCALLGVAR